MYGPESLSSPRQLAGSSPFLDELASEMDQQYEILNAVRRQKSIGEAAEYGAQATRSADASSGGIASHASALAKNTADVVKGVQGLLPQQSGSVLDFATRQAMQPPVYAPSVSSVEIPSWTSSSFSPSGDSLLGSLTRQAMKPPVFGS